MSDVFLSLAFGLLLFAIIIGIPVMAIGLFMFDYELSVALPLGALWGALVCGVLAAATGALGK